MTADEMKRNADQDALKPRLKIAAMLLGIYAAMHLAVGGVVYLVRSPEAYALATVDASLLCAGKIVHASLTRASVIERNPVGAAGMGRQRDAAHCRQGTPMELDCRS